MGNGVANGVVDKSSPEFEAKIQAVRHVAETIERVFSRMLESVILGLVCHNFFRLFDCRGMSQHDNLPYSSTENNGKPNRPAKKPPPVLQRKIALPPTA
ncbi:uncharacterized protein ARMOST_19745 [Armillaria ostoyae]|uniref:Uncharacterized protein n=1 Tax=Armillaria ostoyae TaxID=47428 RepID=A0A284S5J9_ARMOS|nr:uncharacterized protein ARMOST_19745 [Armillaria ostoyae]